ncbi:MAG: hypothetical protein Q8936_12345 [Bacillota bacterium]|nr:hypothetical protein [Bacillota bacterium]
MWFINNQGQMEFSKGKEDNNSAKLAAKKCSFFKPDVEDEIVVEETVSCYNCRFRRWTENSFICYKNKV